MKITEACVIAALGTKSQVNYRMAQPTHAVGASCSGLYEEGKVKHIKCGIGVRNLHARLSLSQYQTRSIR